MIDDPLHGYLADKVELSKVHCDQACRSESALLKLSFLDVLDVDEHLERFEG